jgi:hypothetical protein
MTDCSSRIDVVIDLVWPVEDGLFSFRNLILRYGVLRLVI